MIGNQPTGEPHDFNVAGGLTLKPAARLNPIEIAVDVELQQHRRMVRRPASCLGINPAEPKLGQIELVDKDVDHANRIILANPILQALRKQRVLPAIRALNKALHLIPSQIAPGSYCENHIDQRVFTQPGSTSPHKLSPQAEEPHASTLHHDLENRFRVRPFRKADTGG